MGGCGEGILTLMNSGLEFACSDGGKSFSFPFSLIAREDDDGFKLNSGKPYHFSIKGASKDQVRVLFAEWYGRAGR
jgi:hypothetical protein